MYKQSASLDKINSEAARKTVCEKFTSTKATKLAAKIITYLKHFVKFLLGLPQLRQRIFAAVRLTKIFITSTADKSMWMAKGQWLLPIPVYIINDCGQASHCMPLSVAGVYTVVALLCPCSFCSYALNTEIDPAFSSQSR